MIDTLRLIDFSKYLWRFGATILFLISAALGLLYYNQDSLLYFPTIAGGQVARKTKENPRNYRSPAEHSIPFEEHFIPCADGVIIHAWVLFSKKSTNEQRASRPTVLFFHGNAGNIGLRLPIGIHMVEYLQVNVVMVEYRGYGDSYDAPKLNEAGLKLDAEAALEFARKHSLLRSTPVFAYGQSLGGAVAFHLAHYAEKRKIPISGLLIENTFLSISRMVDHLMPYLALVKSWVLRIGWESYKIAPTLSVPVLYLAGREDELVPHSHMIELYHLSTTLSLLPRIHVVDDGKHNDTFMKGGQKYWQAMQQFIKEALHVTDTLKSETTIITADCPTSSEPVEYSTSSIDIKLGTDSKTVNEDKVSSLPNIPSNLIGLVREATASSIRSSMKDSTPETNAKKKHN